MNIFSWFRRIVKVPFRKAGSRRKAGRLPLRLLVDHLEDRIAPSVSWNIAGSGNWDNPANWSSGQVPGPSDDVVISTAGSATITIQTGDSLVVNSVTTGANDTLSFTGGSLTIGANSTLSGPLSMTGGTLTATGSSVNLTANGSTTISEASLFAIGGATLSLPQMTSYTAANFATFQADGAGSVLDVSALTTVTQQGNWKINATNGGEVKLTGMTSLGNFADGTVFITDTGGSTLLDSNVATLDGDSVMLDGTDAGVASGWTTFTNGTLTLTGAAPATTVTLSGVTDADGSSFDVSGGATLNLPMVTSYTGQVVNPLVSNGVASVLQASGAGSMLSLAGLTNLMGAPLGFSSVTDVQALAGGAVELPALTQISGGDVVLKSDGSNSLLSVPALTSFATAAGLQTTEFPSTLQISNGGGVQAGSLGTFTNGNLTVTGDSASLPTLSDFDDSNVTVQGGGSLTLTSTHRGQRHS